MTETVIRSIKPPCTSPAVSKPNNAENIEEFLFKPNDVEKKYEVSFGCVA